MKRFQDRKKEKDLPPFPGCLGRMINMFELSNGVVTTKMLTEKAHLDVSPAGRDRSSTFKMAIDQFPAQIEDKQRECQLRRNSSPTKRSTSPTRRSSSPTRRSNSPTKRSGGTPVKMLMEQEMWREGVCEEEPPNVIARLMGLNGTPVKQSALISGRQLDEEYQSDGLDRHDWNLKQQKESNCLQQQKGKTRHEHKWTAFSSQPSTINNSKSRHQDREPPYEKRMSLVRQKFAEAKRLATDEKLLHSKEFQEALQFLSSNKDLFLKFLDEPNPLLSNNQHEFQPVVPPPDIKQITILKPSESIRRKGTVLAGKQLYSDGDESEGNRNSRYESLSLSPTNSTLSEPTRIVVLKPGIAEFHHGRILRSPLSSTTAAGSEDDSTVAADETVCSRRLAKQITWQMRARLKNRQDEENLLSPEYSDFYIGDDSFSKSEVENSKQVSGEISEDLEFGTPTSGHSWDFMSRSASPYSASCSSQASHLREPSVVSEAKKRILERWTMVSSSTVSCPEEREARRSTSTLGEMLTIPEVKKEQEEFEGITLEVGTCEQDSDEPFLCLPRSRSVPVSSSYGGIELTGGAPGSQEVDKEKNKKSSSFRGKVSSLFFSKNKRSAREKLDPSGPSAVNNRLEQGSALTIGNVKEEANHFAMHSGHKQITLLSPDENSVRRLAASSCHVHNMPSMPAKDVSSMSSLGSSVIFGEPQDQPSPVSVLDGPFLCDITKSVLHSSENFITAPPQTLSRSPLIGSFSRSLSWKDSQCEVTSPNSLRLSRLFSKADEDQESLMFIQQLVCSAGLDAEDCNKHLLASPLNSKLLEKFSDYGEDGLNPRGRASKERFLFDSVNEALIEITQSTLLAAYPWAQSRCSEHKDCQNDSGNSVADEIWRVIRNWSILDKCLPGEANERTLLVEMILKREVAEMASVNRTRLEMFELNADVCAIILEELVEESLVDLTNF